MSDLIALALIRHLLETGTFDADDVNAIADRVEADDEMAAHQVRCELIEASMRPTSAADHQAAIRRKSIRLVDGGNGSTD